MKNIFKISFIFLFSLLIVNPLIAQDEEKKKEKKEKPVRSPYACTMIIDNQDEKAVAAKNANKVKKFKN